MSDNIDIHPRRKPPTPEQIIAEQKRRATASKVAARSHQAPPQAPKAAPANATPPVPNVPAVAKAGMLATTALDTRTAEQRYVDEISPSMIAGQMVKFAKDGTFVIAETEEEISPDIDFIALCDETLIGGSGFTTTASRRIGSKACSTTGSSCRRATRSVTWTRAPGSRACPVSPKTPGSTRSASCCRIRRRKGSTLSSRPVDNGAASRRKSAAPFRSDGAQGSRLVSRRQA